MVFCHELISLADTQKNIVSDMRYRIAVRNMEVKKVIDNLVISDRSKAYSNSGEDQI